MKINSSLYIETMNNFSKNQMCPHLEVWTRDSSLHTPSGNNSSASLSARRDGWRSGIGRQRADGHISWCQTSEICSGSSPRRIRSHGRQGPKMVSKNSAQALLSNGELENQIRIKIREISKRSAFFKSHMPDFLQSTERSLYYSNVVLDLTHFGAIRCAKSVFGPWCAVKCLISILACGKMPHFGHWCAKTIIVYITHTEHRKTIFLNQNLFNFKEEALCQWIGSGIAPCTTLNIHTVTYWLVYQQHALEPIEHFYPYHHQAILRNCANIDRVDVERINGGDSADPANYGYHVAVLYLDQETEQLVHLCGGAIIDSRYVLTAAHCVFGNHSSEIVVRAGGILTNIHPAQTESSYRSCLTSE
ncbi:unnamed protein product [Trichogramma brassicae]|uniref:Peptidase S1 domain-containing protein n=1 Tax=Trichogramma brassicae TaxID=86971 RepID=A0A6H5IL21_9HYME|nr:unnamed protein product [Trichogramma brassicae]